MDCFVFTVKCLWDGDKFKSAATIEGPIPNAGDALRDGDRGHFTETEGLIPNAANAVWDGDRGQTAATIEGPVPNAGNTIGYSD